MLIKSIVSFLRLLTSMNLLLRRNVNRVRSADENEIIYGEAGYILSGEPLSIPKNTDE